MGDLTHIGEWQKISDLGSGAFGIVSLWKNNISEDFIAIKKCKFHTISYLTEKQKQRWNSEVQMMKIIDHPNIIKYKPLPPQLEVEILKQNPSKLPVLPMEYCSKGNLRRLLCKPKNISGLLEKDVRCLLTDICSGLEHLHKLKITHRDIKPDNIVLQECSNRKNNVIYKIIDLGYAKELNNSMVSFVGTLHYLAPEIFQNIQYNQCVDYWSMGILTFEVICGVLPFLPHLSPFERFAKIKDKGPDVICIYRSYSGQVTYSSELKKEIFLSSCLKQHLEVWLRHVLQFDANKRSVDFPNTVKVFEYLNNILKKRIVNVFSIYKLEFYSYEINESTLISTLKEWISRDISVSRSNLILLFSSDTAAMVQSDSKLVIEVLGDDDVLFVFKKGAIISDNIVFNFPKLLKELFSSKFDMSHIKQLYANTIYYMTTETNNIETFKKGFYLFSMYINSLIQNLKLEYSNTLHTLSMLLARIDCYNSLRKSNILCDIDLSKNWEYRDHLNYNQRLLASLERRMLSFKELKIKIEFISKKCQDIDVCIGEIKKLLEDHKVDTLYNETVNLLVKYAGIKENNGKTFMSDIKRIVSQTIKIKDTLINNKDVRKHLSSIVKVHCFTEDLKTWISEFNVHLVELSKCFDQNETVCRNVILKQAQQHNKRPCDLHSDVTNELLKLPTEYLIQENKELRLKFEEILFKSILAHKNYAELVRKREIKEVCSVFS